MLFRRSCELQLVDVALLKVSLERRVPLSLMFSKAGMSAVCILMLLLEDLSFYGPRFGGGFLLETLFLLPWIRGGVLSLDMSWISFGSFVCGLLRWPTP